ncbi:MAG: FixH family protein [Hyphomicrobiales bacterium]|nr:FixH family protein [Hyphomicrobiales bacterium]MDE2114444.1 FixH family protein [Hyphomicrobiales bacterium]
MDEKQPTTPRNVDKGFKLTGFTVLMMFVAFFGTDIIVNVYMATKAITTFSGEVANDPYQRGLDYDKDAAAARAQQARGWKVTMTFAPGQDGRDQVEVTATDAAGKVIDGLSGKVVIAHPSNMQFDSNLTLASVAPGVYRANFAPQAHSARVVLELARNGERMFRSVNLVILPKGPLNHG